MKMELDLTKLDLRKCMERALQKVKKMTKREREKMAKDFRKEEKEIKKRKKFRKRFNKQIERNLKAIELEKAGKTNQAIKLYEKNVKENFIGNGPYEELAFFYRNKNKINDEIRVLKKAVWVFEKVVPKERGDRLPKLKIFKKMLRDAKAFKQKYKQKKKK